MNLAIPALSGEIKEANSYYEDPFECVGRFDFTRTRVTHLEKRGKI